MPPSPLQDYLRALFMQMDRNHNQRLDMDEFTQAMRLLGEELSERTVSAVRKCWCWWSAGCGRGGGKREGGI